MKRTGFRRPTWQEIQAKREAKKNAPPTSQQLRRQEKLEWRAARKLKLWSEPGKKICSWCQLEIRAFADCELDHEEPGKMGGCMIDTDDNTNLKHRWCNRKKGSQRKERANAEEDAGA